MKNQFKGKSEKTLRDMRPYIEGHKRDFELADNQIGALTYKKLLTDLDNELKKYTSKKS